MGRSSSGGDRGSGPLVEDYKWLLIAFLRNSGRDIPREAVGPDPAGEVSTALYNMGLDTRGFANNTGADQPGQSDQGLCYSLFGKSYI